MATEEDSDIRSVSSFPSDLAHPPSSRGDLDTLDPVFKAGGKKLPSEHLQDELRKILAEHKIDRDEKNVNSKKFELLKRRLLLEMAALDPLFELLHHDVKMDGSVKKKLKVSNADEYDLNMCFDLDKFVPGIKPEVIEGEGFAGFFSIFFQREDWEWPEKIAPRRKVYKRIFEVDGSRVYLRADGLRSWAQGLVHRSLNKIKGEVGRVDGAEVEYAKFSETRSGPAITLEGEGFSVDLVPAFIIRGHEACPGFEKFYNIPDVDPYDVQAKLEEWYLVPVPPRLPPPADEDEAKNRSPKDHRLLFRGNFRAFEDFLLDNMSSLKNVIRLVKIMRNDNGWKMISSYALVNLSIDCSRPSKNLDREIDLFIPVRIENARGKVCLT